MKARRQRSRATAARTDCRFDEKIMFQTRTRGHADQGVMSGSSANLWRDQAVRRVPAQSPCDASARGLGGKANPDHDHA